MAWGAQQTPVEAWIRTETGHQIQLMPNRVYVFGRGTECDLRVDDAACSRRHAKLTVAGDVRTIYLEDLGSKNGTLCQGKPVKRRVQVRSGDRIEIGTAAYTVVINDGAIEAHLDTRTRLGG